MVFLYFNKCNKHFFCLLPSYHNVIHIIFPCRCKLQQMGQYSFFTHLSDFDNGVYAFNWFNINHIAINLCYIPSLIILLHIISLYLQLTSLTISLMKFGRGICPKSPWLYLFKRLSPSLKPSPFAVTNFNDMMYEDSSFLETK